MLGDALTSSEEVGAESTHLLLQGLETLYSNYWWIKWAGVYISSFYFYYFLFFYIFTSYNQSFNSFIVSRDFEHFLAGMFWQVLSMPCGQSSICYELLMNNYESCFHPLHGLDLADFLQCVSAPLSFGWRNSLESISWLGLTTFVDD